MTDEMLKVNERYARRKDSSPRLYSPLMPSVYMSEQEKERALIRWVRWAGLAPVLDKRLLEIGCGSGANLRMLLRLGFRPENLVGNELIPERADRARHSLPATTEVVVGDATSIDFSANSFDVVYQSTVFSSILDESFQNNLADKMWTWTKPGGGVLWYDFIYDNPNNPDVRGVPLRRIRELFPNGDFKVWRITLAPPLSRLVTRLHPALYTLFNAVPLLRTHVLCWIRK